MGATAPIPRPADDLIRVLIVDDNAGFRDSLVDLLEAGPVEVVGQAGNGREAVDLVVILRPDVVLLDVRMPEMDGIETARRIRSSHPSVGIVALTGLEEQRSVRDMLVAGASGYVLKDADGDEILDAVLRAASGGGHLSAEVTPAVIEELTEALERERRRARQLEVAQEALLERSARRQQLIGRLGHELRTPVTVILGLAHSLRRQMLEGDDVTHALDVLLHRAEGLAKLVARFEAAVESGLTEWVDVHELTAAIASRDTRIQVQAADSPAMTEINRTAGLRILEELVDNALAFSPAGTPVIVRIATAPDRVEIRVIDHGSGVPAGDSERIFEPLEQAEDLLTRTHQGVGLGLTLARLSARAMDGEVSLESSGPDGSVFLWRLAPARQTETETEVEAVP